jgi:serine/threonine protein kinase
MINTIIGKYKLIRLIGEGGMASVYEAEHELLGTKVAIKVLNPILSANAQIRERFINEAKLMASLDHPNITKVIDFDDQAQQLSIVMEYLSGEDLNDKIKRNGPLSENEITDIFTQTLSAFQYAHEKGIVHRDIKPSNIFVLQNGFVKILDFGIAKLFGQGNEMTQTGTQMGTPIYMSPEQVKGDKSIDYRSDIYSLGVTLFFAINGKPPYNSNTESQFDIFTKIVHETLPDFTVSSKFYDLVLKTCQKNREERFQSCDEIILSLNNNRSNSHETQNILETNDLSLENDKISSINNQIKSNENQKASSSKWNSKRLIWIFSGLGIFLIIFGLLLLRKSDENAELQENKFGIENKDSLIVKPDSINKVEIKTATAPPKIALDDQPSKIENLLLGRKTFGVQFIWDNYGFADIKKDNNILKITGEQWSSDNSEYAIIDGELRVKDDRTLIFNGKIKLFTNECCGEINLNRSFTFKRTGSRNFFRLQERNSLCDEYTCCYYMDIFI